MIIEVPVIIDAASDAKKVIAVATSLSVAILPNGIFDLSLIHISEPTRPY